MSGRNTFHPDGNYSSGPGGRRSVGDGMGNASESNYYNDPVTGQRRCRNPRVGVGEGGSAPGGLTMKSSKKKKKYYGNGTHRPWTGSAGNVNVLTIANTGPPCSAEHNAETVLDADSLRQENNRNIVREIYDEITNEINSKLSFTQTTINHMNELFEEAMLNKVDVKETDKDYPTFQRYMVRRTVKELIEAAISDLTSFTLKELYQLKFYTKEIQAGRRYVLDFKA